MQLQEMSTDNFPLQPLEQNGDQDKRNANPGYLQEPLEDATKLGTKSTRKVQFWKDWPWKRILNTVVSLLGFTALFAGISMIAPFYPILVSSTHFLSPPTIPDPFQKNREGVWEQDWVTPNLETTPTLLSMVKKFRISETEVALIYIMKLK